MSLLRGKHTSLLLVAVVCLCAGVASADRLNLSHPHYPLVASQFVDVTYDPSGGSGGAGLLTAWGTSVATEVDDNPNNVMDIWGDFILTVEINTATGAPISGELYVDDWDTGDVLFSSTVLTQFGWGTVVGDDIFEYVFTQEGDMLANDGDNVGIILYSLVSPAAPWDFTQPFDNLDDGTQWTGVGYSKTFYMPEPSTMIVMSIAGIGLLRRRRR